MSAGHPREADGPANGSLSRDYFLSSSSLRGIETIAL